MRQKLRLHLESTSSLLTSVGPENIVVAACGAPGYKSFVGKTLRDIAVTRQADVTDVIADLVVCDRGRTSIFLYQMDNKL